MTFAARQAGRKASVIAGYAAFFFYSIALTDLLRREIKRRNWLDSGTGRMAARLGLSALVIGTVQTLLVVGVSFGLTGSSAEYTRPALLSTWISITLATVMWTTFYVALTAPRRYRDKEVGLELALRCARWRPRSIRTSCSTA